MFSGKGVSGLLERRAPIQFEVQNENLRQKVKKLSKEQNMKKCFFGKGISHLSERGALICLER